MRRHSRPNGAVRALIVVDGASGLRTRAASGPIQRHTVAILGTAVHMEIPPHF